MIFASYDIYVKTYLLTIYYDSQLNKNDYYNDIVCYYNDDVNNLRKDYAERIDKYALRTIFMGLEFDKKPYIQQIYDDGVSRNSERYCIIGHGAKYVKILFNLLYDKMLTVKELAVLGYFCIETLVSSELDQTVGTSQMGPDVMILKEKEEPKFLDPMDADFNTAKTSSQSLRFKYKLVYLEQNSTSIRKYRYEYVITS
jgi:20S proteasome alpha/beta subunit